MRALPARGEEDQPALNTKEKASGRKRTLIRGKKKEEKDKFLMRSSTEYERRAF